MALEVLTPATCCKNKAKKKNNNELRKLPLGAPAQPELSPVPGLGKKIMKKY